MWGRCGHVRLVQIRGRVGSILSSLRTTQSVSQSSSMHCSCGNVARSQLLLMLMRKRSAANISSSGGAGDGMSGEGGSAGGGAGGGGGGEIGGVDGGGGAMGPPALSENTWSSAIVTYRASPVCRSVTHEPLTLPHHTMNGPAVAGASTVPLEQRTAALEVVSPLDCPTNVSNVPSQACHSGGRKRLKTAT